MFCFFLWVFFLLFFVWYTVIRMLYLYLQLQNTVVGLVWEKKSLESLKSTPLIVCGTCATGLEVCSASVHSWGVSLWGQSSVGGDTSGESTKGSASLPDGPLRRIDRICCFALWSIKIWEVYSSRRPIHSRVRSVSVLMASQGGPRSNRVVCDDPAFSLERRLSKRGHDEYRESLICSSFKRRTSSEA